jgi:hypothetical protein
MLRPERAVGVVVISRYDWSWSDKHGLGKGEDAKEGIGLADWAIGGRPCSDWAGTEGGVALPCEGEYEFARFSCDTKERGTFISLLPYQHCVHSNPFPRASRATSEAVVRSGARRTVISTGQTL